MNLRRLDLCFRYYASIFVYFQNILRTEYISRYSVDWALMGDKIVDIYIRKIISVRYAKHYESRNLTISPHKKIDTYYRPYKK